jgi:hypothetical protein
MNLELKVKKKTFFKRTTAHGFDMGVKFWLLNYPDYPFFVSFRESKRMELFRPGIYHIFSGDCPFCQRTNDNTCSYLRRRRELIFDQLKDLEDIKLKMLLNDLNL